jgi:ATP-binding cassette subfamily B protein
MTKQELVKQIKAGNRSSSGYMSVNAITGIVTTVSAVWLMSMFHDGIPSAQNVVLLCAGIVVCQILKGVFYGLGIWKAHEAAYKSLAAIRQRIVAHMRKLPIRFFQKRKTGDLSNIINHDVEQVEVYLAHAQPEIFISVFMALAIGALLLIINWKIGLAMLLPVPIMLAYQMLCNKLQSKVLQTYLNSTRQMNEDLVEYIAAMPLIKAFSGEETRSDTVLAHMGQYLRWVKRLMFSISGSQSLGQLIMESGIVLVIMIGFPQVVSGTLSVTTFILCIVLSHLFMSAFMKYMSFHHANIVLNGSAASISTVLGEDAPEEPTYRGSTNSGDVELKQVTFRYDDRDEVLHDISACFRNGTKNALVGSSGSGKSTIANLILGFWPASQGKVTIGGQDIAGMNSKDLANLVSIVQQDTFMFNTTLAENIRIGKPDATMDEVIDAAKKARIHELIVSLPKGYDTVAGEAGAKLSGGEKQRISIARMMLKNTPIVVLDEATAAIDPHNEHLIQAAIANLSEGKTVISIAHHLNTVQKADQIVVMDSGRIVAAGTHSELMDSCPLYAEMVKAQREVDEWQIKGVTA